MAVDKLDIERGRRICGLMDSAGVSNIEISAAAGVSSATVTQWRKGSEIKNKYLPTLARSLNTTIDFLLTGESEPSPQEIQLIIKTRRLNSHVRDSIVALIDNLIIDL